MEVRNRFSPQMRVRLETPADAQGAHQSMKDECDINQIIPRFKRTGVLQHVQQRELRYGDFTALDFQDALNTVRRATEMFEELPAKVRKKFGNDPGAFAEFASDPKNVDALRELDLLSAEAIERIDAEAEAAKAAAAAAKKAAAEAAQVEDST